MNRIEHDRKAAGLFNPRKFAVGLTALLSLSVAIVYAYATAFSYFSAYDDEGYAMVTIRGFLEGQRLYIDIFTYYGPFYYLYEWFIHSVLTVPLTHDATTALCLLHWLTTSCLLALAAGLLTRSRLIALLVFMQATLHLTPLAREPGHPQELAAVLLGLVSIIAAIGLNRRWALSCLAAICAALISTKINVGLFLASAVTLTLASNICRTRERHILFWPILGFGAVLPFVLMRPNLSEDWALAYAAQSSMAILAAGMVGFVFDMRAEIAFSRIAGAVAVFAGCLALFVVVALLTGTSSKALLQTAVAGPSSLGSTYSIPLRAPFNLISGALALIGAGVMVACRRHMHRMEPAVAAAKGLFAVAGLAWLLIDYNRELGYLLPWSWLALVPRTTSHQQEGSKCRKRILLVMVAVWESLQAYPVAGTQAVVGSMLLILICACCLLDSVTVLVAHPRFASFLRSATPRNLAWAEGLGFAGLLYFFATSWCNPFSAWRYYAAMTPLGLSGAEHLRLPEDQVQNFTALTRYLETHADAFYTVPGLNSLYFWAHQSPPTYLVIPEALLLSDSQQKRVIVALQQARHPMIVLNDSGSAIPAKGAVLASLIQRQGREIKRVGTFRILDLTPGTALESLSSASAPTTGGSEVNPGGN